LAAYYPVVLVAPTNGGQNSAEAYAKLPC
jgi:hypothetical protein